MNKLPEIWGEFDRSFGSSNSWRPLLRELDDFFSDALSTRSASGHNSFVPAVDVEETNDHYVMRFDMPGLEKEHIDIEVHGNQLIVSGERKREDAKGEGKSRFVERRYGRFQRIMSLPEGIRAEGIEADYRNGVLTVAVPRPEETKRRKIQIGENKGSGFFNKLFSNAQSEARKSSSVNIKSSERSQGQTDHDAAMTH